VVNYKRGEAPLTIKGVDFVLKFDTNAFAELEGALGEHLGKILQDAENRMGLRFLRAALYASLQHDQRFKRKFTLEKAGEMITAETMPAITVAVRNAMISALTGMSPEQIEEAATKNEKPVGENGEAVETPKVDPFELLTGMSTE
jgi:hypothetical protein